MVEALTELPKILTALGYTELLSSLNPTERSADLWLHLRDRVREQDASLIDLFLLGRQVEEEKLDSHLLKCLQELTAPGLFRFRDGTVSTAGFSLNLICGIWLFHELPHIRQMLYFGDDSMALVNHQVPRKGQTCLDLCSGPGIQGLYAARSGEYVTTVELNPQAVDLCSINAVMNGLYDRMDIRKGDLYRPIGENERFDRIMANPPLLPVPKEIPYPFVGHGGEDGFAVTGPILDGCAAHLTDDGYAQVLGIGLGDGKAPLFLPLLENISGRDSMDIDLTLIKHMSILQPGGFFHALAKTSAYFSHKEQTVQEELMAECYARQGASEYLTYYLLLRRGKGEIRVRDLSGQENLLWYAR